MAIKNGRHCEEQLGLSVVETKQSPRSANHATRLLRRAGALPSLLLAMTVGLLFFVPASSFAQTNNLDKWVGTYSYEETSVVGIHNTGVFMNWELTIDKTDNGYSGKLSISGYQTLIEELTDISGTENTISVKFIKQTDGPVYDYGYKPKAGELLFSLRKLNGKLLTKWAGESPHLHAKFKKECRCFIPEKRR